MKLFTIFIFTSFVFIFNSYSQDFNVNNQITIGGNQMDDNGKLISTLDGGFLLISSTFSGISGNKTTQNFGSIDIWLIKLNINLAIEWQISLGGDLADVVSDVLETPSGDFLVLGHSSSDVSGNKTTSQIGNGDIWLVKIDNNGSLVWQKSYGSSSGEISYDIINLSDGNYLISARTSGSNSGDVSGVNNGSTDYWILKINEIGDLIWEKNYGGNSLENTCQIKEISNGDIILLGVSSSDQGGDKSEPRIGPEFDTDIWVLRLDSEGTIIWDKTIGGESLETSNSFFVLNNFIYISVQSLSEVSGNKTEPLNGNDGNSDYWIIKMDLNGNILWDRSIGGDNFEVPLSTLVNLNGELIVAGQSLSSISGDKSESNLGLYDYWIVALDTNNGSKLWDKTIGGSDWDNAVCILEKQINNYLISGFSESNISGDKSEMSYGDFDLWVVELSNNISVLENETFYNVYPNPFSDIIYIRFNHVNSVSINVYDIYGKLIDVISHFNNSSYIDLSSYSKGYYFIEISSISNTEVVKVVKN